MGWKRDGAQAALVLATGLLMITSLHGAVAQLAVGYYPSAVSLTNQAYCGAGSGRSPSSGTSYVGTFSTWPCDTDPTLNPSSVYTFPLGYGAWLGSATAGSSKMYLSGGEGFFGIIGAITEVDPIARSFRQWNMTNARRSHSSYLYADRYLLVAAGIRIAGALVTTWEVWDVTNTAAPMRSGTDPALAKTLWTGSVQIADLAFIVGGDSGNGYGAPLVCTNTVNVFSFTTYTWGVSTMSIARCDPAVATNGNVIIIAGGLTGTSAYTTTIEVFTPYASPASVLLTIPLLSPGRGQPPALMIGTYFFVAGGEGASVIATGSLFNVSRDITNRTLLSSPTAINIGTACPGAVIMRSGDVTVTLAGGTCTQTLRSVTLPIPTSAVQPMPETTQPAPLPSAPPGTTTPPATTPLVTTSSVTAPPVTMPPVTTPPLLTTPPLPQPTPTSTPPQLKECRASPPTIGTVCVGGSWWTPTIKGDVFINVTFEPLVVAAGFEFTAGATLSWTPSDKPSVGVVVLSGPITVAGTLRIDPSNLSGGATYTTVVAIESRQEPVLGTFDVTQLVAGDKCGRTAWPLRTATSLNVMLLHDPSGCRKSARALQRTAIIFGVVGVGLFIVLVAAGLLLIKYRMCRWMFVRPRKPRPRQASLF